MENIVRKILESMDFEYSKPIGYQPLRWTVEDDTILRPRYDMYKLSDTITVGELMEMLFDTWHWNNNQLYHSNKDEFNSVYGKVLDLFEPAIRSEQLKVVRLIRPDWYGEWILIWEVELSKESTINWLRNKNLIELIESIGIEVAEDFKRIIQEATLEKDFPNPKNETNHFNTSSPEKKSAEIYVFKKNSMGNTWEISFKGVSKPLKHYKGLLYIQELLKNPNQELEAQNLNSIVQEDGCYQPVPKENLSTSASDGFNVDGSTADEINDKNAIKGYQIRIKELDEEIEELEKEDNPINNETIEKLKQEKDTIADEIKKSYNPKTGKLKTFDLPNKKLVKSVSGTIDTALKNIAEVHPELHSYLKKNITKGTFFQYTPSQYESLNWIFD